jgi:hypothetical protein
VLDRLLRQVNRPFAGIHDRFAATPAHFKVNGRKDIINLHTTSTEANPRSDVPAEKAMNVAAVTELVLLICSAFLM